MQVAPLPEVRFGVQLTAAPSSTAEISHPLFSLDSPFLSYADTHWLTSWANFPLPFSTCWWSSSSVIRPRSQRKGTGKRYCTATKLLQQEQSRVLCASAVGSPLPCILQAAVRCSPHRALGETRIESLPFPALTRSSQLLPSPTNVSDSGFSWLCCSPLLVSDCPFGVKNVCLFLRHLSLVFQLFGILLWSFRDKAYCQAQSSTLAVSYSFKTVSEPCSFPVILRVTCLSPEQGRVGWFL